MLDYLKQISKTTSHLKFSIWWLHYTMWCVDEGWNGSKYPSNKTQARTDTNVGFLIGSCETLWSFQKAFIKRVFILSNETSAGWTLCIGVFMQILYSLFHQLLSSGCKIRTCACKNICIFKSNDPVSMLNFPIHTYKCAQKMMTLFWQENKSFGMKCGKERKKCAFVLHVHKMYSQEMLVCLFVYVFIKPW